MTVKEPDLLLLIERLKDLRLQVQETETQDFEAFSQEITDTLASLKQQKPTQRSIDRIQEFKAELDLFAESLKKYQDRIGSELSQLSKQKSAMQAYTKHKR